MAEFEGPIIRWQLPMPLNLFAELGQAVAAVCERHGLDCYYLERDGLGVVHVRPEGRTLRAPVRDTE